MRSLGRLAGDIRARHWHLPAISGHDSGETDSDVRQLDGKTFCESSHGRNKFRPPIQLLDIAGNLRANIRYENPPPHNEKKLFGGSTDPYRCIARVAAHDSASPLREIEPPPFTSIAALEAHRRSGRGIMCSPRRCDKDVEEFIDPVGGDLGRDREVLPLCRIDIPAMDDGFECHAASPPANAAPWREPLPTFVFGGDTRQLPE